MDTFKLGLRFQATAGQIVPLRMLFFDLYDAERLFRIKSGEGLPQARKCDADEGKSKEESDKSERNIHDPPHPFRCHFIKQTKKIYKASLFLG